MRRTNSNLRIIALSNGEEIFDYLNNTNEIKNFYFTNWVDNKVFPFIYGSGMVFCGLDPRIKYVIYFVGNGIFFTYYDTRKGEKVINWKKFIISEL